MSLLNIPKTNSFQEQESFFQASWNTLFPHVKDTLIHSAIGVFKRVISLPYAYREIFAPLKYLEHEGLAFSPSPWDKRSLELTHSSVEEQEDPMCWINEAPIPNPIPSKEQLHYIIDRTHQLAEQMGILKDIKIYPAPGTDGTNARGCSFSKELIVSIDRNTVISSGEVIDFILAHELAHIAHNHILEREVLSVAFLTLDVFTALFFSPLAIPLCEAVARPLENYLIRAREGDADRTAMITLNTNRGAIEFFTKAITQLKNIRNLTDNAPPHILKDPVLISRRKRGISPEGDSRIDLLHPPYSKRLADAKAFQPRENRLMNL